VVTGGRGQRARVPALVVHGGAGADPADGRAELRQGMAAAAVAGWRVLVEGGRALDAVEAAVRVLEDHPRFNAGRGSVLTAEGTVEMDASIMDGARLDGGAVAAIRGVRHPVSVARRVLEDTPHVLLAGDGARRFAERAGAELCTTRELLVGRELERYDRVRAGDRTPVVWEFDAPPREASEEPPGPEGTVGAVALDTHGHVAAATSTGGTQDKLPGRVGDTPILGAGTWADDLAGAASATGRGEAILRAGLARVAVDLLAGGRLGPEDAARRALATLDRVEGRGGLILVDLRGRAAAAFTTPRMARGIATACDGIRVAVDP